MKLKSTLLSNLHVAITGGVIALLAYLGSAHGNEVVGFKLSSCGLRQCIQVKSPKAWQSRFIPNYAFSSATILILDKKSQKVLKTIEARDVFYDLAIEKILIREPIKGLHHQAFYDVKAEQLVEMKAPSEALAASEN